MSLVPRFIHTVPICVRHPVRSTNNHAAVIMRTLLLACRVHASHYTCLAVISLQQSTCTLNPLLAFLSLIACVCIVTLWPFRRNNVPLEQSFKTTNTNTSQELSPSPKNFDPVGEAILCYVKHFTGSVLPHSSPEKKR